MPTKTKDETPAELTEDDLVKQALMDAASTPEVKYTAPYELAHAKPGDAGYDLRAAIPQPGLIVRPLHQELVPTGVRLELPEGYAGLVIPRSGLALKYGITITNSPGLIDSGYRGEIGVLLQNKGGERLHVKPLDRIAQLVIIKLPELALSKVEALSESERGEGGYGSTGIE